MECFFIFQCWLEACRRENQLPCSCLSSKLCLLWHVKWTNSRLFVSCLTDVCKQHNILTHRLSLDTVLSLLQAAYLPKQTAKTSCQQTFLFRLEILLLLPRRFAVLDYLSSSCSNRLYCEVLPIPACVYVPTLDQFWSASRWFTLAVFADLLYGLSIVYGVYYWLCFWLLPAYWPWIWFAEIYIGGKNLSASPLRSIWYAFVSLLLYYCPNSMDIKLFCTTSNT